MGLFKLIWTSTCGQVTYTEVDWTEDREKIGRAIVRLTRGPGRFVIGEVKVIDALGCLVWHWKDGKVVA